MNNLAENIGIKNVPKIPSHIDIQERCNPYLNDKVKAFKPYYSTHEWNGEKWITCMYIGHQCKDVTDYEIKKFCDKINSVADQNLIEGFLIPMNYMPLADSTYLLLYYTFTDNQEAVEQFLGETFKEGSLPKKITKES